MAIVNKLSEDLFLPLSDFITGNKIRTSFKFLQRSQNWSNQAIEEYQNMKLSALVSHAYANVPYYRELFDHLKLNPKDIQSKEDLKKLPILTKAVIKSAGLENFTSRVFAEKNLIKASSSGSTGEPLFFYTTREAYSMNIASSLRGWYWTGYRLGDKYIKLSQNRRNSFIKQAQDFVSNNLYLTSDPLTDDNFEHILKKIEIFKPTIIRGYPDPLYYLALYKHKSNGRYNFKPKAIATTGNTLFPEVRKEIESAFGCPVFDAYNCEGNSVVFECPSHTCYHSTEEYGISEVIDENDVAIEEGIGRLISTDLHNLAHPFIRYDTQDLVEIDKLKCVCGRNHLKINRILGRDSDVFKLKTGRSFIVHNFTGFFQTDTIEIGKSVDQFQVICRKDGSILFRLVVNNKYTKSAENYIKNYWENEFKQEVSIEVVDEIPLTRSGKRRFIIKE